MSNEIAPDYMQDDAAIDRWNDAALAAMRYQPCPADDADSLAGYAHGLDQRKVCVVMPRRPEGYYHAPIGSFE
jgi:hypothetical protein